MSGYVKLYRKIRQNWIWDHPEFYRAWSDILMEASWKPTRRLVGDKLIAVPRGGLVASERYLSGRWKWSTTKVRGFLKKLVLDEMITREVKQGITVITICKYESYADGKHADKAEKEADYNALRKQRESESKKLKKGKKEEQEAHTPREAIVTDLDQRALQVLAAFGIETEIIRLGSEVLGIIRDAAPMLDDIGTETIVANASAWREAQSHWLKDLTPKIVLSKLSEIYHFSEKQPERKDKYDNGF